MDFVIVVIIVIGEEGVPSMEVFTTPKLDTTFIG
jgi:hypothetical protein